MGADGQQTITGDHPAQKGHGQAKVNFLSLIGATIGLASLAMPWILTRYGEVSQLSTLTGFLWSRGVPLNVWAEPLITLNSWFIPFVLLLAGTLLAFFTPLGGLLQGGSLAWFYRLEVTRETYMAVPPTTYYRAAWEGGFGVGFYVALLSMILIVFSLIKPIGMGYEGGKIPLKSRLYVFSNLGRPLGIRSFAHTLARRRSWLLVWFAIAIEFSTVTVVVDMPVVDREPLAEVPNGVIWTLDFSMPPIQQWYLYDFTFNDSHGQVSWQVANSSLGGGFWTSESLGNRPLPGLSLVWTIVDRQGNGFADPGDSVIVTATNGTSFVGRTEYKIAIFINRIIESHHVYVTDIFEVTFVFHDGELESRVTNTWHPHLIL